MTVREDPRYTSEYLDPDKRSIANAVQVFFTDGTAHRQGRGGVPHRPPPPPRRGLPVLEQKFRDALATRFPAERVEQIANLCRESAQLDATPVSEFVDRLVV